MLHGPLLTPQLFSCASALKWDRPARRTAGLPAQTCGPALPYSRLSLQTLAQMSAQTRLVLGVLFLRTLEVQWV